MRSSDSKDIILEKTILLLLRKGYDGVSISDIQQETGMSRGLLYHYYGNKEGLFREAGESFIREHFNIDPKKTADYGLQQMINYILKSYQDLYRKRENSSGAGEITMADYDFLIYQLIGKEESISKIYSEVRRREMESWTSAATRSLERKEIRNLLAPERIAHHFVCLLDGVWLQMVEKGTARDHIKRTREILNEYYELLKI
ncbi:MAG: TetR/AcrR family transcriptional regulator [Bacteroidales bacterium]|nr:TetR/AcrR family transcriptional regulator [Bacteroidales bacterium]